MNAQGRLEEVRNFMRLGAAVGVGFIQPLDDPRRLQAIDELMAAGYILTENGEDWIHPEDPRRARVAEPSADDRAMIAERNRRAQARS